MAALVLLCWQPAYAELADRFQVLHLEADSLEHDEKNKRTVAQGRVVATQGSMLMRAGRVEVRQLPHGHNHIMLTAAGGQPAYLRQKRQGLNEHFEGQASRMERNDATGITRLTGNARMRRLVAGTLADEVVGAAITYNEKTEVYRVTGSTTSSTPSTKASTTPTGRVRVFITPSAAYRRSPTSHTMGKTATSNPSGRTALIEDMQEAGSISVMPNGSPDAATPATSHTTPNVIPASISVQEANP